jgi:hypothetical protein
MELTGKLQIREGMSVTVVGAPDGFTVSDAPHDSDPGSADAAIFFCKDRAQVDGVADQVVRRAGRDALTWVAYPKAKKLGTDLNRDTLHEYLKARGVRPVRQVSVDETWSALRFRPL